MRFALNYFTKRQNNFLHLEFERNLYRYSNIELTDRFYRYQYLRKIFLLYLIESQMSRSEERYLFFYQIENNNINNFTFTMFYLFSKFFSIVLCENKLKIYRKCI